MINEPPNYPDLVCFDYQFRQGLFEAAMLFLNGELTLPFSWRNSQIR